MVPQSLAVYRLKSLSGVFVTLRSRYKQTVYFI